jgi:hypothetical protein
VLGICLTFAFTFLQLGHHIAARRWLGAAALLAWVKVIVWGATSSVNSSLRIATTAVFCATIGVLLVETLRWLDRIPVPAGHSSTASANSGTATMQSQSEAQQAAADSAVGQNDREKTDSKHEDAAPYCFVTLMPVHTYVAKTEVVVMNPFDHPVQDVVITVSEGDTAVVQTKSPRALRAERSALTTLKRDSVPAGPSFTGLKLQAGTYSVAIQSSAGKFSETLVLAQNEGKTTFDLTLTRLSDGQILIPGSSLLKGK